MLVLDAGKFFSCKGSTIEVKATLESVNLKLKNSSRFELVRSGSPIVAHTFFDREEESFSPP